MKHWPRRKSPWDGWGASVNKARSGQDPINPVRIQRLRRRGVTYKNIGIQIAKEDGRKMPYTSDSVFRAVKDYKIGRRDEDGEKI